MLQCPRCSNPLTVSHCHKTGGDSDTDDRLHEGDIIHYPMYQNTSAERTTHVASSHVSHVTHGLQYHQEQLTRARDEERDLKMDLHSLQLRVIQNNLQQLMIQQEMALQQQPTRVRNHTHDISTRSLVDIEAVLRRSRMELEQSGWYYGHLSWQQSTELLHATSEGTFLVRDSQDPRFLYSLSLQRAKDGPTSVRIAFSRGKFSLDADDRIRRLMPEFDSVGALVCHYVETQDPQSGYDIQKTINNRLYIKKPLYKQPPSLAHSARLSINRNFKNSQMFSTQNSEQVQIPRKLLDYLQKYSYSI